MFCEKCGKKCNDGVRFCPECGNRVGSVHDRDNTPYYQEHVSTLKSNPVRMLSILIKVEGILNLIVAIVLLSFSVYLILGPYYIYINDRSDRLSYHNKYVLIHDLVMIFICILCIVIIIIISIKNFKSFMKITLSNPIDIIRIYKTYTTGKIVKKTMLIIIGSFLFSYIIAINILPFIFTMINRRYVLNNLQIFNEIEENYLENQTSTENSDQSL